MRPTGPLIAWPSLGTALAWIRAAQHENEAVAAFERTADELASLGAPVRLVERCRDAADEERAHTRACVADEPILVGLDGQLLE